MMPSSAQVTIVTSGHLCTSPRVVREANALVAAGLGVRVVSAAFDETFIAADIRIATKRAWTWHPVATHGLRHRVCLKAQTQLARLAQYATTAVPAVNAMAHSALHRGLARAVLSYDSQLIIGHNLPGLVAASIAGQTLDATVLFDVEDWHPGEVTVSPHQSRAEQRMVEQESLNRLSILDAYIPTCHGLIASSPLIAKQLSERYTLPIVVVRNAGDEPCQDWSPQQRQERLRNGSRRCFWFSQTIGPDRGLEQVIPLLANAHPGVSLTLQGAVNDTFSRKLQAQWHRCKGAGDIEFIGLTEPLDLAASASQFDIGLSLETNTTLNRRICLTNKVFAYLQWAMPQIISTTPAQSEFARDIDSACLLVDLLDSENSARSVQAWFEDADALCKAVSESYRLYDESYNYGIESRLLIDFVQRGTEQVTGGSGAVSVPRAA